MDNTVFTELQKLNGKRMYEIWRHAQDGSSVNLPEEDKSVSVL